MLRNQNRILALALAAMAVFAVGAIAADPKQDGKKDGQALYKEYCKSCHLESSPNGEYTPMSLIQEQWQDFFEHKLTPAHEKVTDPSHEGKKVLDLLTPEQLELLTKWTIDHAADSENPMTCG